MRATKRALALTVLGVVLIAAPATLGAQEAARPLPNPTTRDMFRLDDLESYKQFSQVKNFEIVGHSYFRGPWVVPGGAGTGINTLRICGTIAYLAGYNPTVFGALIVDVANPRPGCCPGAHTAAPVPHAGQPHPSLLVLTDEHFSCPPGFVRILDITNPKAAQVLSTIHIAGVDDRYDFTTGKFVCPPGQQSSHLPYFEPRSHGSLFYQAWYDQGLRAFDISNPFSPKEVGYFISPDTSIRTQIGRHTREAYVDPATNLIYVTDGNGGGLTVLRYTGPMPQHPPIPGAR